MSAIIVLILRALFGLSLLAFLGWITFVLWKDLRQTILQSNEYKISPINLEIIEDGKTFTFNQPEFYIGRDPQAELQIQNDTLSAIHARVFYKNNQWMIEDLQSTNGTFINDERLSTPSVLVEDDEVKCGQVLVHVSVEKG